MYRGVRMVEITEVLRLWRAGVPRVGWQFLRRHWAHSSICQLFACEHVERHFEHRHTDRSTSVPERTASSSATNGRHLLADTQCATPSLLELPQNTV